MSDDDPKIESKDDPSGARRFFGAWNVPHRRIAPTNVVTPRVSFVDLTTSESEKSSEEVPDVEDVLTAGFRTPVRQMSRESSPDTVRSFAVSRLSVFSPESVVSTRSWNTPRNSRRSNLRARDASRRVLDFDFLERDEFDARELSESEVFIRRALVHTSQESDIANMLYNDDQFEFGDDGGDEFDDYEEDEMDEMGEGEEEDEMDDNGIRQRAESRWFFTNSKADVVRILKHYTPLNNTRNKIQCTPEEISHNSSFTRLSSERLCPLIIFQNQLYRPKERTKDGHAVAKCTQTIGPDRKSCPGALHCSWETGEVVLHKSCIHRQRRDFIAMELILRKLVILEKNGCPKERLYIVANKLGHKFKVPPELLGSNESIGRKINSRSYGKGSANEFPPSFDWTSMRGVTALMDNCGNFKDGAPVTVVWKVDGADRWLNRDMKVLHLDGKYSQVPGKFQQLYEISGRDSNGKRVPLIFALSSSSSRNAYKEIFNIAREQGLHPQHVFCDFELATIGAVEDIWPNAAIHLCWRHFKCSLKKKLIEYIGVKLSRTSKFQLFLKSVYTLSFANLSLVDYYFSVLKARTLQIHPKMPDYFDYLTRTYIGGTAMFKKSLWNCHDLARLKMDFTNNSSEGFFSKYSRMFDHNSYQQMNRALRRSTEWCQMVYSDLTTGRIALNREKKKPLYKNTEFLKSVLTAYQCFDDFEKHLHCWMGIPSLYH